MTSFCSHEPYMPKVVTLLSIFNLNVLPNVKESIQNLLGPEEKMEVFRYAIATIPWKWVSKILKRDFSTSWMIEFLTWRALNDNVIFMQRFFTCATRNCRFFGTAVSTKPIFTDIFKMVEFFFIYVATFYMKKTVAWKTRNMPKTKRNIFGTNAVTTAKIIRHRTNISLT